MQNSHPERVKICLAGRTHDVHIRSFAAALAQEGFSAITIATDQLGIDWNLTLKSVSGEQTGLIRIRDRVIDMQSLQATCLWRIPRPRLEGLLHADDVQAAERAGRMSIQGMAQWLTASVRSMIKHPYAALADNKALQMIMATDSGLTMPSTVIGNDEQQAAALQNHVHQLVYKPLAPHGWEDNHVLPTTKVDIASISPTLVRLGSGIFQEFIRKRHEVRAIFWGGYCIAAAINATSNQEHFDWRMWPRSAMEVSPTELPKNIQTRCVSMLQKLGLTFGVFDFIVDMDGQYFFIEVNPGGNFLFCEDLCPELPLLETTVQFLTDSKPVFEFHPIARQKQHALADYRSQVMHQESA